MTSPRLPSSTQDATLNIIGSGQLARALAPLLREKGGMRVQSVWSRTPAHAYELASQLGAEMAHSLANLPAADFTLIAVKDDALASIALQLSKEAPSRPGQIVFHCSGSLPACLLAPLQQQGAAIASCHPLRSFADPEAARHQFAGTLIAIEGDSNACEVLTACFTALGGICQRISEQNKLLYHAGAVMACNYLNTLLANALLCMTEAGIDRTVALAGLIPLMRGTIDNMSRIGPAAALSGPLARGDSQLLDKQSATLQARAPGSAQLYRTLALHTLPLLAERGMPEAEIAQLRALFS